MSRYFLIVVIVLSSTFGWAQTSFREVDSTSYAMYNNEQWLVLSEYGKKAIEDWGYDFYYLNVRTGVAFFELKKYKEAKGYFERALKNDSGSLFALEYLFWCHYDLEDELSAYGVYKTLPDSIQDRMDYKPSKALASVFVEGGMKFSNDTEAGGHLSYGSIAFGHKFSPYFDLYHAYTYLQQEAIWGNMRQHQYLFLPGVNLKKGWRISLALNYANYQSNLNFRDSTSSITHTPVVLDSGMYIMDTSYSSNYIFNGIYRENALHSQLNITKRIGGLTLTPHVSLYKEWIDPDYLQVDSERKDITYHQGPSIPIYQSTQFESDTTQFRSPDVFSQLQAGLDLSYTFKGKYTLGGDLNFLNSKYGNHWNFSPYINFRFNNHWSLSGYYVKKSNYVMGLNGGSTFLNTFDEVQKFSLTGSYTFARKYSLYLTYQYEQINDILSLRDYTFNSLFVGLKIKL